jgi:predicted phosphodiesterase
MKIRILSDLHLEFSAWHPPFEPPETDADVVVLAGDIDNGTQAIDWAEHTFAGKPVLYVPGNHEYYDGEISAVASASGRGRPPARRCACSTMTTGARASFSAPRCGPTSISSDAKTRAPQ